MKRIDRLVLGELIGPWLFGVAMFTVLLIAATYLGRIADYVVQGIPAGQITELTLLLLPAILVKTFAMATLLAALLAFGRLSSDSEIVALRASGASLYRIVAPVAVFSIATAIVAFIFNEGIVPSAAKRSVAIISEIASQTKRVRNPTTLPPVVKDGRVVAFVMAQNFSLSTQTLGDVTVVTLDKNGRLSFVMQAEEMRYSNENDWEVVGGAEITGGDLASRVTIEGRVVPEYIPTITISPAELIAAKNRDNDVYSMSEIQGIIARGRQDGSLTPEQIRNYEYGYWNKIALPLAAFIFGTLGATLGIRSHRTGTAAGFAISIGIIFAYFTLANFMNVWALGGVFPPYVASFTPIAIGLVASSVVMWRRNA